MKQFLYKQYYLSLSLFILLFMFSCSSADYQHLPVGYASIDNFSPHVISRPTEVGYEIKSDVVTTYSRSVVIMGFEVEDNTESLFAGAVIFLSELGSAVRDMINRRGQISVGSVFTAYSNANIRATEERKRNLSKLVKIAVARAMDAHSGDAFIITNIQEDNFNIFPFYFTTDVSVKGYVAKLKAYGPVSEERLQRIQDRHLTEIRRLIY